ncbi:MAG: hypothetical protein AB8B56_17310 [Crocinitomicaceae bacterium]
METVGNDEDNGNHEQAPFGKRRSVKWSLSQKMKNEFQKQRNGVFFESNAFSPFSTNKKVSKAKCYQFTNNNQ